MNFFFLLATNCKILLTSLPGNLIRNQHGCCPLPDMRRYRMPRIVSSTLLLMIFIVLIVQSVLRVRFHFGLETKFYRRPPSDAIGPSSSHQPNRPWYMKGGTIRPTESRPSGKCSGCLYVVDL